MEASFFSRLEHPDTPFSLRVERRVLRLHRPARLSRGELREREIFLIRARAADGRVGVGECAPLPGRSPEASERYAETLATLCAATEQAQALRPELLRGQSAARFGLEGALTDMLGLWQAHRPLRRRIELHGLIWRDSAAAMLRAMEERAREGFRCLKFKLGALPWAEETALVREAARRFPHCRLHGDANGAYADAPQERARELAEAGLHLLEQPLPPGDPRLADFMAAAPLPIALDEELTGFDGDKIDFLRRLRPACIVVKPTLHGGLRGAWEWECAARELGCRVLLNSALEGSVGLEALARWCVRRPLEFPQGLGTGQLYADDCPSAIRYQPPCLEFL
ncbi:MAG: enolase C-terminal domain-like protein [Akkermansia sp.]